MDFSFNDTEYYGDHKFPFSGPDGFNQDFIRFEWAQTWSGFILPIITGLISTCSSALILFIIFKSTKKLKDVYHRILALISVLDIIFSLALATSTLPIPNEDFYSSFKGPRLGNHGTCQTQGFFLIFGYLMTPLLMLFLCYYYVSISCRITQDTFKKVEAFFYPCAIAWGLIGPIISIRKDYINPAPYDPHCLLTPYPLLCIYTDVPCEHGDKDAVLLINFWSKYIIAMFAMIASGFSIVVIRVAYNERQMNKALEDLNTVRDVASSQDVESTAVSTERHPKRKSLIKLILLQALAYILSFLLTWIFICLPFLSPYIRDNYTIMDLLQIIFQPLGGFWNMLIFVHYKILLVKHTNSNQSYYGAFKTLLSRPEDVPEIMLLNLENVEIADRNFEFDGAEADEESPKSGISYEKSNLSAYDGISAEAPDSVGFSAYDGLSAHTSIAHDPISDTPSKSLHGTMESISETGRIKNQNILYGYEQKHSFYDEEDIENFKRRNSNSSFDA
ncbi:hypothetical protein CTEN210_11597 [Chaetoceros tenuissimus]|uniref:Uncharacterized protein n=1 Tax=Chaetoceros tenuissimus TaxID=426638 RepID=A0AAD3CZP2_9STRA|nr:hypothetical protein CTEN210_11597 [Chaetoceros tenuissimus]